MSCIDINVFPLSIGVMRGKKEKQLPLKLGCVFEHWIECKIKHTAQIRMEKKPAQDFPPQLLCFRGPEIVSW